MNASGLVSWASPVGMSLGSTGILSWSDPLQGAYTVTVTAKDSKTGLSGRGVYSVIIAGVPPPGWGSR